MYTEEKKISYPELFGHHLVGLFYNWKLLYIFHSVVNIVVVIMSPNNNISLLLNCMSHKWRKQQVDSYTRHSSNFKDLEILKNNFATEQRSYFNIYTGSIYHTVKFVKANCKIFNYDYKVSGW